MTDVRLNIPTFEDDFESVVDSMRKTGEITSVTQTIEGFSILETENDLSVHDVISVSNETETVTCKILIASATSITVNENVPTDSETWKAEAPFFMDGHISEISKRLKRKDESANSVLRWTKYPLVVLLQDIDFSNNKINPTRTSIDIIIVNQTEQDYTTVQRREKNFTPILDPLYNKLIFALRDNSKFRMTNNDFNVSRKYFWGAVPKSKNPFNDRLDAIEINNLNLELIKQKCI